MYSIVVVLPAYNESLTIRDSILDFHSSLPEAEIIVVDNNSADDTFKIAEKTLSENKINGQVFREWRQGKGFAVRRAFKMVDADIYVLSDADMTYSAKFAPELIAKLNESGADMVVGDRHSGGDYEKENKRSFHNFGNSLVAGLVNKLFAASLKDIMSGYRVFSRRFVKNYPILVDGFELETDMTLHALDKRMNIVECPISYKDRPSGSDSKLNTFSDGAKVLFTIFQLLRYYRPMVFFTLISLLFFLSGLAAGIPPIYDYVTTGFVDRVPLAILATGLEIIAVLSLAIGLVLDSISHNNRMSFEKDY